MEVVTLVSNDGKNFDVSSSWVTKLNTVKNLMEDIGADAPIPVQEVNSKTLQNVLTCLNHEVEGKREEMDAFVAKLNQSDLFEMILAANYLDYAVLLDAACMTVSNMIKGKTPQQIRETFGIKNDFTAEEEKTVAEENSWVEEK